MSSPAEQAPGRHGDRTRPPLEQRQVVTVAWLACCVLRHALCCPLTAPGHTHRSSADRTSEGLNGFGCETISTYSASALGTQSPRWSAIFQDFALGMFSFLSQRRLSASTVHLSEAEISSSLWGMFNELSFFVSISFVDLTSFQSLTHPLSCLIFFVFFYVTFIFLHPINLFRPSSYLLCSSSTLCPSSFIPLAGTIFPLGCFPNPTSSDLCPLSASIPDNSLSVELEDCSRREQKRDYTARLVDRSSNI